MKNWGRFNRKTGGSTAKPPFNRKTDGSNATMMYVEDENDIISMYTNRFHFFKMDWTSQKSNIYNNKVLTIKFLFKYIYYLYYISRDNAISPYFNDGEDKYTYK